MESIYEKISKAQQDNQPGALCVIVATKGSTPRKTGAKMLVYKNGDIYGTIGGGELERKVIENALCVINEKEAKLFKHDLLRQHGMCCGGGMEIYIEPIMTKRKLYIFGAGHTGKALAKFALSLEFEIVLIDSRKKYLDELDMKEVNKMNLKHQLALQALPFDENTFVVIVTHSHPIDRDILAYCIKQPFAYLGMIGSQRKVEMTKKRFIEGGIASAKELKKVDMPMGIDISAEGPDEIAISILAKLIEVKNITS